MPGQVNERLWEKAKALVRQRYPELSEDGDRFWQLVEGIYQKMMKGKGK